VFEPPIGARPFLPSSTPAVPSGTGVPSNPVKFTLSVSIGVQYHRGSILEIPVSPRPSRVELVPDVRNSFQRASLVSLTARAPRIKRPFGNEETSHALAAWKFYRHPADRSSE